VKKIGKIYTLGFQLVFLLWATLLPGQTKAANIWASVQFNRSSVVVGEALMVTITVYTSTWFTSAPEFGEIQVPEAMMVEYQQRTGALSKTIGRRSYPAIEKKYVVYPFRVGENSLPALNIVTESPPEGDYKARRRVIKSPERTFTVLPPPEGTEIENWLTAYDVELTESWDKSLEGLKQGDVLERQISITARGSLAALIPPLELHQGDFGTVYSKTPVLDNIQNQNSFTGTRTETWTYLMESEGSYAIPGIEVVWFDPGTGTRKRAGIDAREISIAVNPDMDFLLSMQDSLQALLETGDEVNREAFEWRGLNWWQLAGAILICILLIYILFKASLRIRSLVKEKRELDSQSEKSYLEILLKSGREGEPAAVMQALINWFDLHRVGRYGPEFEHFICAAGDAELKKSFLQLERILYAGDDRGSWSAVEFTELIRKNIKESAPGYKPEHSGYLTELNPLSREELTCM